MTQPNGMSDHEFADRMIDVLNGAAFVEADDQVDEILEPLVGMFDQTGADVAESFERGGIMTNNAGFTVRMADGTEFQVTVVQAR